MASPAPAPAMAGAAPPSPAPVAVERAGAPPAVSEPEAPVREAAIAPPPENHPDEAAVDDAVQEEARAREQAQAVDIAHSIVGDRHSDENRRDYVGITEIESGMDYYAEDPAFRPRRNPARLWTAAAILFFLAVAGAGGALYYFGPPQWAVRAGLVADNKEPDLLFYLAKPAERRKLPNGAEYFAFSARIVNSGDGVLSVPPVEVQLRDRQDRLVFSWTPRADKAELKPGEEASINESRLDIPKNAENLSLTFVDNGG